MSNTPLSDYITKLVDESPEKLISEFYGIFLTSNVGLIMNNMPEAEPGSTFTVSGSTITSSLVSDPNGNQLIKVCADPDIFESKFESKFEAGINALMSGEKVIEMLLKTEGPKGLLVCSAASFHSYPIYLETAKHLASNGVNARPPKKWWQFWK